jgi:hypothetical protein
MTPNVHNPPSAPTGNGLPPCPETERQAVRALVLDSEAASGEFLDAVADVCRDHGIRPVVLSVAMSEPAALRRQESAKALFDARGVAADFDLVVGSDIVSSVTSAALWRRCTHAIVPPLRRLPWWHAWQQYRARRLRALAGTVTLMTVAAGDGGGYQLVPVH